MVDKPTLNVKNFKTKTDYKNYQPSDNEKIKIDYVEKRYQDMVNKRTQIDGEWNNYQKMINAYLEPYKDTRSSSNVPLASAMIELYVAEAIKILTEYQFRAENPEYDVNAKVLEYVWNYDWRINNRKKVFINQEYIAAGFGTSIIYTGFEKYTKYQKDLVLNDENNLEFKENSFEKENIIVKGIDIRDFVIDNQAQEGIEDAIDCGYIQWISYDRFQELTNNILFKNIDKVSPVVYSNENREFLTENSIDGTGKYVKLLHYWNVEKDAYMIIANGKVLIREQPIMSTINGEKALPFVIRIFGKKNYSIYGRGLCESLMLFNSEVNNLREMLMDAIRRSNTEVLALGNGLTFDGVDFSYENKILTFDGNLAGNFQQINGTGPNAAIFNYYDRLLKDIAVYTGIDIQNLIGQPQQTAFQTEVQREASQKRINVWLTNRDLAYERFANLYKDLLQTYFPRQTADGLYPKIRLEDKKLENKKFKKSKGSYMLEVKPEILRGDLYVDVFTNTNMPTINAVEREQKLSLVNSIANIVQGYTVAQQGGFDLNSIMPLKSIMEDLFTNYNIPIEQTNQNDEVKEGFEKIKSELENLKNIGQQTPETQSLPTNQLQGQPQTNM